MDTKSTTRTISRANHSPLFLYCTAYLAALVSILALLLAVSFIYCPDFLSLRPLCQDEHYKYLVPLLIPVTSWFVIANWVGWEYFRYA